MIFKNLYPLVSCICVTANRPHFLLKAIIYFYSQNYPNKELVISYPKNDLDSKKMVNEVMQLSGMNIIIIERDSNISLGMCRNEAVNKCNGEYICTWDDDDWHDEHRLVHQCSGILSVRQKREACILPNVILYDLASDQAFYSDPNFWEGTLFCKKDIVLQHPYLDEAFSEGARLIEYLATSKYLHYMLDNNLYGFIYHGRNTLSHSHFVYYFKDKEPFRGEFKDWVSDIIYRNVTLG